jgi:hypothetical protein
MAAIKINLLMIFYLQIELLKNVYSVHESLPMRIKILNSCYRVKRFIDRNIKIL